MKKPMMLAGTALVMSMAITGYAQAQVTTGSALDNIAGTTLIDDTIDDIAEATQDQFDRSRDQARFGTAQSPQGFRGSLFASGTLTSGNTDTADFALGGRFTIGQGLVNHSIGLAVEYGEADDERSKNRILGLYDLTYDLSPEFYAFVLGRAQYDEFASIEQDYFLGVGPGYRIFNEPGIAWRVQAGPGVRRTETNLGDSQTDLAGILSSRFFYDVNNSVFLTNDTDILYSDVDTLVSNDLALNVSLTGPLSLRVGLRTEYTTEPVPGTKSTDNSLNAAVVYSFQ